MDISADLPPPMAAAKLRACAAAPGDILVPATQSATEMSDRAWTSARVAAGIRAASSAFDDRSPASAWSPSMRRSGDTHANDSASSVRADRRP